jgi:hypothetical protein
LTGEPPRIALSCVDQDDQLGQACRAAAGDAHAGAGLSDGAGRLPEDDLASAGGGEYQLRALLAGPVQDEIDGVAPPGAGAGGDLLDDL